MNSQADILLVGFGGSAPAPVSVEEQLLAIITFDVHHFRLDVCCDVYHRYLWHISCVLGTLVHKPFLSTQHVILHRSSNWYHKQSASKVINPFNHFDLRTLSTSCSKHHTAPFLTPRQEKLPTPSWSSTTSLHLLQSTSLSHLRRKRALFVLPCSLAVMLPLVKSLHLMLVPTRFLD